MNGNVAHCVSTVSLPAGLDVSLVGGGDLRQGGGDLRQGGGDLRQGGGDLRQGGGDLRQGAARQRKYNYSFKEKDLLVTLIERHGDVVESRTGDGVTSEQKVAAWTDIQARFNELNDSALERSITELKKCYWNLKQKTKKALDAGREAGGTARVDRVLWRIAQLAPEQFEGLLDIHCEVVDAPPEHEAKPQIGSEAARPSLPTGSALPEPPDASDLETSAMSREESPGRWQGSQPSPPAELDMYPIPSDYLSVELGAPPEPGRLQYCRGQYRTAGLCVPDI
ncbi:uncharacterized protein LOC119091604 [Pollicipes pollicipes]|uniref:uncharacterized protein LOC119091604 n=1 Tax=Pollicipes pollicipes TaxID=41117 RepID=UPI0018850413|nr:uncharacterized protein LOC119091604 [Pollicipes pollicipes]